MVTVYSVLCMTFAVLASSVVSHLVPKLPASVVQIGLGILLVNFLPSLTIDVDPNLFLLFFIAPLLYWDAVELDKHALVTRWKPILSYSLGLVLVVVILLGLFIHLVIPSIPLAAAFALAAALAPTDAVAVSELSRDIAFTKDQEDLLKAESLLNDASGVVSFQFAVAALATGAFSLAEASLSLAWTFVGGILVGLALAFLKGLLVHWARRAGLEDVTFHVLLQVVTPFVFYIVANWIGVSGILAVVAAGVVDSMGNRSMAPSSARLNIVSKSVWRVLAFTLNGIVFVLLGTVLPSAIDRTWAGSIPNVQLVAYVLAITLVLVVIRFAWCLVHGCLRRGEDGRLRWGFDRQRALDAAIMTLSGPKGAITLMICFTIPKFAGGVSFAATRAIVIFLGAATILVSLVLANIVVPLIAPKKDKTRSKTEESMGRVAVYRNVIAELARDDSLTDKHAVRRVIASYESRIEKIKQGTPQLEQRERELRELAVGWESIATNAQIREGTVTPIVGYGYLIELERKLARNQSRGALRWLALNVSGWLGQMARHGIEEWGVTREVKQVRRESRARLRERCAEYVLEQLGSSQTVDTYPAEAVQEVTYEYQRTLSMLRGQGSGSSITLRASQIDAVRRVALQIERDEIGKAHSAGIISRETARVMRDNVSALEFDLEH